MREIKFRGKCKETGRWVYGYFVKGDKGGCYISSTFCESCLEEIEPQDLWLCEVDCKTVGQYTGLKDKNGREIYEGDILQFKRYYLTKRWSQYERERERILKEEDIIRTQKWQYETDIVKVINGCVKLEFGITGEDIARGQKMHEGMFLWYETEEKIWDFEVIGNIHDNPELIKRRENDHGTL